MNRRSGTFVCYDCGQRFDRTLINRSTVITGHSYGGRSICRSHTAKVNLCPECASKRRAKNMGCLMALPFMAILVILEVLHG